MTEARCVETDCRGVAVSQSRCVGHVDEDGLASYVAELLPDGMWDARGATIDETRCLQLVELLASAEFTGDANFSGAQFTGGANFGAAQFTGGAKFDDAQFSSRAYFGGALFTGGDAIFAQARFSGGDAIFAQAQFSGGDVYFSGAQFTGGDVNFTEAQFTGGNASFGRAQFTGGDVNFRDAQFGGDAKFAGAQFSRTCFLGPLRGLALDLRRAVFEGVVTVHAACSTISASNLRARESFTLAGRGCEITMIGTQFDKPAWVASSADAVTFPSAATQDDDDKPPRLLSVEGTDLSNVTLVGLDLGACRFVGAYNLGQLHIDGPPDFAETPSKWRWARRRTLVEEHVWRATYDRRPDGWYPPQCRPRDDDALPAHDRRSSKTVSAGAAAARVQAAYRELRKSFEDARNEPGAADFYYGEMEMRRMASRAAPPHRFEHALLTAYWAVSGYGLRASRALLALLLALAIATVLFVTVGFGPSQQTVYVPVRSPIANQPVAYKQTTVPDGKPGFREAAYYSVQSATSLLREPTTEPLTTIGRTVEIALRLLGPLLLGLAVLALRGRVKR